MCYVLASTPVIVALMQPQSSEGCFPNSLLQPPEDRTNKTHHSPMSPTAQKYSAGPAVSWGGRWRQGFLQWGNVCRQPTAQPPWRTRRPPGGEAGPGLPSCCFQHGRESAVSTQKKERRLCSGRATQDRVWSQSPSSTYIPHPALPISPSPQHWPGQVSHRLRWGRSSRTAPMHRRKRFMQPASARNEGSKLPAYILGHCY